MSILSDWEIVERVEDQNMIEPFEETLIDDGVISYGLSSYGYDFRIAGDFKVFHNAHAGLVDPKAFDKNNFLEFSGVDYCDIPPNSFVLARTVEYFRIPLDILTICVGKSTYARCGLILNVTPFEPGWEGEATVEISNSTPLPARVYANEGIGQIIFFKANNECDVSYADRKGKYQAQEGIVLPRMK